MIHLSFGKCSEWYYTKYFKLILHSKIHKTQIPEYSVTCKNALDQIQRAFLDEYSKVSFDFALSFTE